ncbi:sugar transferase [Acetatifactor muris]|uniref:Glucosyltransferase 3 n=1 Tax=Acetatifactor muris TaxID=879566 RepID=A0A2K4ZEP8_9FIRM|nr:sugar transferase [Acetatifactor muris]MCR2048536.1 sugar transferase [Acetatifactor muris]SOY28928.1 Beta-1,6-galactofuranosyltransferase WbbI [Acetatifactor muris]
MKVHITNIYGVTGIGLKAQQAAAEIAKRDLQYQELGIYFYPVDSDSPDMLRTRLDGILASVSPGDVVIMQSPTWNDIRFDESLMNRMNRYSGLKKIIWLHDVQPLMKEAKREFLSRWIELYNQADLIIAASQNEVDVLRSHGLRVRKTVIQRMWDCQVSVDRTLVPRFQKVINFAGDPSNEPKLAFARNWKYDNITLAVTVNGGSWAQGKNIRFLGWYNNDNLLVNALRRSGGFGLLWSEDAYWREYMRINASYKFSTYLAAGIPVIVPSDIAESDTILRKNLGIVADSLDEAVERVAAVKEEEYKKMAEDTEQFAWLLREGYFTRKVLTDAVFQVFAD